MSGSRLSFLALAAPAILDSTPVLTSPIQSIGRERPAARAVNRNGSTSMSDESMDRVSARFAETVSGGLQEVADGIHLLPGFGNCTLILGDDGAAVVDPGLFQNGPRAATPRPA